MRLPLTSPVQESFDLIARPYRWLEYLSFGRSLERCRYSLLAEISNARNALILGDGDGRFLLQLLKSSQSLRADVVDLSPVMLRLSCDRLKHLPNIREVSFYCADVRQGLPSPCSAPYDLVVTHFFLDCLTDTQVTALIKKVQPHLAPGALWVVSEFVVPARGIARLAARVLIRSLYFAFRGITGLRVTQLPDYRSTLHAYGFNCKEQRTFLGGILCSQLWRYDP